MSQEWFSANKPFYLIEVFHPGEDLPMFRLFLYESILTVHR